MIKLKICVEYLSTCFININSNTLVLFFKHSSVLSFVASSRS